MASPLITPAELFDGVLCEIRERMRIPRPRPLVDSSADCVARENIEADVRLAGRSVELLHEVLVQLRDAERMMWDEGLPNEVRAEAASLALGRNTSLDLELHTRSIYELLYSVKELIDKLLPGFPQPSATELQELERLCTFRRLLVTHKAGAVRSMRAARGGRYEDLDVRIGGSIYSIDNGAARQLNAIFDRTSPHLPADVRDETNWNARLQLAYEFLSRIPANDRGSAKALIARYGVQSDPPMKLARMVLALARVYLPLPSSHSGGMEELPSAADTTS